MSARAQPTVKDLYFFNESNTSRDLLGGKGAGLAEMTAAGLPVPPGFTITTQACLQYYADGRVFPEGLIARVDAAVAGGSIPAATRRR